jgi:hypothetical protein
MTRRPVTSADRDTLILQATSAAHCWFLVGASLAMVALAGMVNIA